MAATLVGPISLPLGDMVCGVSLQCETGGAFQTHRARLSSADSLFAMG
mgnify:FL=1